MKGGGSQEPAVPFGRRAGSPLNRRLGQSPELPEVAPGTIPKVDLYGTALVVEKFGQVLAPGGAGVVISSPSGQRRPALTAEQNKALATTPADGLLGLPMFQPDQVRDSLHAYQRSKRGNSLRAMAEAVRWGHRGARVNTISPGSNGMVLDTATGPVWTAYHNPHGGITDPDFFQPKLGERQ